MAEILKVTTPLVDKLPVQPNKPVTDPSTPFNLSDVSKVIKTVDPTEILSQNTGFVPKEDAPRILADLLRDPAVTASLIKNIYLLQEVINLLPANNQSFTTEVEQLFSQLMLRPEDIVGELVRQEEATTLFKGELFDQLRTLLFENTNKPDFATSIGVLLKGLNASMSQRDALDSVANNLTFLLDNLKGSANLSEKLTNLIGGLRSPDAPANFSALKEQVMAVLQEVENSVLFTPQMEKTLPLIVYNLSRFNDNAEFLPDALRLLLSQMDGEDAKTALVQKLQAYVDKYASPDGSIRARADEKDSQVMETLSKIIGRQADSEELQLLSGDKLEKIVQSLLSSPSNFTPLLHFIIPVEFADLRAFAEIWIDPNAEDPADPARRGATANSSHMLLVFDVEGVGRFESELFVQDKRIAMNLLCPAAYLDAFSDIGSAIKRAISKTGYTFEAINIGKLDRTHSLMDVFTDLPHKRTGIDVRI